MLRVLTYHRVDDPERTPELDPALISATPDDFRRQMEHLRRWYHPVALGEVLEAFQGGGALPQRAVHVTVDDAYRDFRDIAWPILRELGIPVTVFVATAYAGDGGRSFWWDRLHRARLRGTSGEWRRRVRRAAVEHGVETSREGVEESDIRDLLRLLPHDEMERLVDDACREAAVDVNGRSRPTVLGWDELRKLASEGVAFGAHTRHHVALSRVDEERARREIRGSFEDLERELGRGARTLAYPYGVCNRSVARIAGLEGCDLAFTCEDGLNRPGLDEPRRLHRTNITRRTSPAIFTVRMLPWFARIDRWRHRHEEERRSA